MDGAGERTIDGTTAFVNDSEVVQASIIAPLSVSRLLTQSSAVENIEDIKRWMAKPVIVSSTPLSSTDTVSTFAKINVPGTIVADALLKDKLSGFLGFRATTVIRWVINGNRFQQGRYMLCYIPYGGMNGNTTRGNAHFNTHLSTLVQRTSVTRIELDITCDTEGLLRIPYSSALNYYPLTSLSDAEAYGTWGAFQIFPYSVVVAPTGTTSVSSTVFVHFEDVELIGTTYPQSGRLFSGTKRKKKSITEQEQDSAGVGPVTSVLGSISSLSGALVKIPFISSYASNISWVSDILGGAASRFGWSKPINLAHSTRVTRNSLMYFGNVDSVDQSQPLAMYSTNQVGVLPGFSGTDIDEMDFSYLFSIPVWQKTLTWATTDAVDAALTFGGVHPFQWVAQRTLTTSGMVVNDFTPGQLVASMFNYWRGSIVYTFKIVKTEFHSGRLQVVFGPTDYNAGTTAYVAASRKYCRREIIDIRETSEFTIVIPYQSSQSYQSCATVTTGGPEHIGFFQMTVLDKLCAPSAVSTSVTILWEVSYGPDFEVAFPKSFGMTPVFGTAPQSGNIFTDVPSSSNICEIQSGIIGGGNPIMSSTVNAEACIGERVSSLRAMLKSMSLIPPLIPANFVDLPNWHVVPFGMINAADTATNFTPNQGGDLYSVLASCYLYSRGGVRLKLIDIGIKPNISNLWVSTLFHIAPNTIVPYFLGNSLATYGGGGSRNFANVLNGPRVFTNLEQERAIEIVCPQYSKPMSRVNWDHAVGSGYNYLVNTGTHATPYIVEFTAMNTAADPKTNSVFVAARGGADDCNFGGFISVPPMTYFGSAPFPPVPASNAG